MGAAGPAGRRGRAARADRVVQRPGRPVERPVKDSAGVDFLLAPRRTRIDALLVEEAAAAGAEVRLGVRSTGCCATATAESSASRHASAAGNRPCCAPVTWWRPTACGRRWPRCSGRRTWRSFRTGATLFYAYVGGVDWRAYEFHVASGAFAGVFPTHDGEACVWLSRPDRLYGAVRHAAGDRAEGLDPHADRGRARLGERVRDGPDHLAGPRLRRPAQLRAPGVR